MQNHHKLGVASEIQTFCDINEMYLSSISDTAISDILLANKDFLFAAALDWSPLYSGTAQTLYEMATDSVFIEYTPLPQPEMGTKSMALEPNDEDIIKPELNVYPNPTESLLYVEYDFTKINDTYDEVLLEIMGVDAEPNCENGKISIYTDDGKLVDNINLNKTKGMETINIQDFKPAHYLIEITDCNGFSNSVQIVKQ